MKEKKEDVNKTKDVKEEIDEVCEEVNCEIEQKEEVKEVDKISELNDQYLRLRADFDNFRKRAIKEKEDTIIYANSLLMEKLLPVIDNFKRALASDKKDNEDFVKGVEMVANQLNEILKEMGLEKIEDVGSMFDPNLHHGVAVGREEDKEEDEILEALQEGYTFKNKVIRPSMVKVNKK